MVIFLFKDTVSPILQCRVLGPIFVGVLFILKISKRQILVYIFEQTRVNTVWNQELVLCNVNVQCLISQIKIRLWCFNEENQNLSKQVQDITYFKVPKRKGCYNWGKGKYSIMNVTSIYLFQNFSNTYSCSKYSKYDKHQKYDYFYLLQNLNQNPRTLLPKFYGLYCYQVCDIPSEIKLCT